MKTVGAGLGRVALYASGRSAVLGGNTANEHFKFSRGFDRGKNLVCESVAKTFYLETSAVEQNFTAERLSARDAALKRTAVRTGAVGGGG